MNLSISNNTQAILLLTAPLITGQGTAENEELLTPGEYRRLARQLRQLGRSPSDLLGSDSAELLREINNIVPAERVGRLLDRGFLISQAFERWQSRAIWVLSRADTEYPKKIKNRLQEESPAVLYGCGEPKLLEAAGLAVVGSRHVDDHLVEYTEAIGRQCTLAKRSIVSGGAQGIDLAAMTGALESGGRVTGVLADGLERAVLNRENRNWLLDEQLVLVSPYDPSAGFNVGHAMQRNKIIYALADAALVVSAEFEKGGTWAGATEQLQKYRFIPVYVRSTGDSSRGIEALRSMGAKPWPEPQNSEQFMAVFDAVAPKALHQKLPFPSATSVLGHEMPESKNGVGTSTIADQTAEIPASELSSERNSADLRGGADHNEQLGPAQTLMNSVRHILVDMLKSPKNDAEIASILQVSKPQMKQWLDALVKEGTLEKRKKKPVRYALKQKTLL
jgi:predicted Rossmann fold nucleotide-binding protein DprA/Smf involved in DNA uptake